jgi:glucosamine-phosphate N-acetyltransferase
MSSILFLRPLQFDDFHRQYLQLLQLLTVLELDKILESDFQEFVDSLTENHQIWVMEDCITNKIVGTVTILIEQKLIHNFGKVCHIEDVVVDTEVRGQNIGKKLVQKACEIASEYQCYKTILDCDPKNDVFYEKCGFVKKGSQMALYH